MRTPRKRPICFSVTGPQRAILEHFAQRDATSLAHVLRSLIQKEVLKAARVSERREAALPSDHVVAP